MRISASLLVVAGCGSGFHYDKLSSEVYPVTQDVAWLAGEPTRPYTIIARFRGAETSLCPLSQPHCSLYEEAMRRGADAIWVQHRDPWTRPEQWVVIQGKMTRIPPATYEQIEGAFIRYR